MSKSRKKKRQQRQAPAAIYETENGHIGVGTVQGALYRGEIGRLHGVKVLKTHIYVKSKPRFFPSNWLWYSLAGLFTESYQTDYNVADTSGSQPL